MRDLSPSNVIYSEDVVTTNHAFNSRLNHPRNWQGPFEDSTKTKVSITLLGEQMVDFITKANEQLMPVSRYNHLFKIHVFHDTCGETDYPLQYNIHYESGWGEQDGEILAFLRQWDPRNHSWPNT